MACLIYSNIEIDSYNKQKQYKTEKETIETRRGATAATTTTIRTTTTIQSQQQKQKQQNSRLTGKKEK